MSSGAGFIDAVSIRPAVTPESPWNHEEQLAVGQSLAEGYDRTFYRTTEPVAGHGNYQSEDSGCSLSLHVDRDGLVTVSGFDAIRFGIGFIETGMGSDVRVFLERR